MPSSSNVLLDASSSSDLFLLPHHRCGVVVSLVRRSEIGGEMAANFVPNVRRARLTEALIHEFSCWRSPAVPVGGGSSREDLPLVSEL
jgi:hypothetical protein